MSVSVGAREFSLGSGRGRVWSEVLSLQHVFNAAIQGGSPSIDYWGAIQLTGVLPQIHQLSRRGRKTPHFPSLGGDVKLRTFVPGRRPKTPSHCARSGAWYPSPRASAGAKNSAPFILCLGGGLKRRIINYCRLWEQLAPHLWIWIRFINQTNQFQIFSNIN